MCLQDSGEERDQRRTLHAPDLLAPGGVALVDRKGDLGMPGQAAVCDRHGPREHQPCFISLGLAVLLANDANAANIWTDLLRITKIEARWTVLHAPIDFRDLPKEKQNGDRKSTRLNSSHRTISYAVFC